MAAIASFILTTIHCFFSQLATRATLLRSFTQRRGRVQITILIYLCILRQEQSDFMKLLQHAPRSPDQTAKRERAGSHKGLARLSETCSRICCPVNERRCTVYSQCRHEHTHPHTHTHTHIHTQRAERHCKTVLAGPWIVKTFKTYCFRR